MEILSEGIALFRGALEAPESLVERLEGEWLYVPPPAEYLNRELRNADYQSISNDSPVGKELNIVLKEKLEVYNAKYPGMSATKSLDFAGLKYEPGFYMKEHADATITHYYDSHLSVLFFFNDTYEGGELRFPIQDITLKPEAGSLLIFPSIYLFPHEVLPLTEGTRYTAGKWYYTDIGKDFPLDAPNKGKYSWKLPPLE